MEVVTSCSPGQGAENERDRPWKREGKVGWKESDKKRRREGRTALAKGSGGAGTRAQSQAVFAGSAGRGAEYEVRRTGSGGGIVVNGEGQLQKCNVGKREGGATQGQTNASRGRGTRREGGSVGDYREQGAAFHSNLLHRHLLFCAPSTSISGSGSRANTTAPTHWQPDFVWLKLGVEDAQRGDAKNYNESASMARVSHLQKTALYLEYRASQPHLPSTRNNRSNSHGLRFIERVHGGSASTSCQDSWYLFSSSLGLYCVSNSNFSDSSAAKCLFFYFPEARAARKKWQERSSHGIITSFGRVVSPILSKKPIEVRGNK
ncbi:hypothetical protein B0H14DRAFT_2587644 [Mycena olivaceomarginata]|nr:hypothetical protein B0H14DRAFT_2587644 [Mycena olivaceomarginata]